MGNSTGRKSVHPIIVLMSILFAAMILTYLIDSGSYQRDGRLVVPGSFEVVEKDRSISHLWSLPAETESSDARPVGIAGTLLAIPRGLEKAGGLIFMVLAIGGMFGIMTKSGAIDSGLMKLVHTVRGSVFVLIPCLMVAFSAGSTFLGLASEYLLIIPIIVKLADQLGLKPIIGFAIVTIAVKVGYIASVTSPVALSIAQPLVGLPVFSGAGTRFVFYVVFLVVAIGFMFFVIRGEDRDKQLDTSYEEFTQPMPSRHRWLLLVFVAGVAGVVYGSNRWQWSHEDLTAYYIGLSIVLGITSGLGSSAAANAFVDGMKKILMASVLIGVATAVSIVLADGQVLDTIVARLTGVIPENSPYLAASGMFVSQLFLDVAIPSTSGQAAVSMPILGPIGQISGVSTQTTVLTFLFGNGLTNMITPTSGTLLAYLATAKIPWTEWARFVFPLWLVFFGVCLVLLGVATVIGF